MSRKERGPYDWTWHDTLICVGIVVSGLLLALGQILEALP